MIADLEVLHVGTYSLDDAGTLVASNPRVTAMGHIAGDEVLIGMTQTRGDIAHEQFTTARFVDLDVLDRPVLVLGPPQHPSTALDVVKETLGVITLRAPGLSVPGIPSVSQCEPRSELWRDSRSASDS